MKIKCDDYDEPHYDETFLQNYDETYLSSR